MNGPDTDPGGALGARLEAAGASAAWPATPELRDVVLARIAGATSEMRRGARSVDGPRAGTGVTRPHRSARRSVVRGLALALLAVLAAAGIAAALGYRLPGLELTFVESLPPAGVELDLGSPVPLAEALAAEPPRVLVPAALPSPATVWVRGSGDSRIATMAWRAAPGQPVLEHSDLSVLLMAVPGEAEEGFLEKALPEGTRLEPVSIDGDRGWWISGAVHELLYRRPDGLDDLLRTRLVGDTLVFSRDGTLYRFESALGREATIAIARTLH